MERLDNSDTSYVRIAVISGSDKLRSVRWADEIPPNTDYPGNNDLDKFISKVRETHLVDWRRYEVAPRYFRQKRRWSFNHLDLVYVSLSDPDLNPKSLKVACEILSRSSVPILNHPARIAGTRRSKMASAFANEPGVMMPKTVRLARPRPELARRQIDRDTMGFPIIVRSAGSHTGRTMRLCRDMDELAAALNGTEGALYLTEFVDFRSTDGLYRKYRFVRIGRQLVFRHLIVSDNWLVHASDIDRFMIHRPALIAEERDIVHNGVDGYFPGATDRIGRITEATGLDYVGFDCAFLADGRILVFETNATMNFFPIRSGSAFAHRQDTLAAGTKAFQTLLEDTIGRPLMARLKMPLET